MPDTPISPAARFAYEGIALVMVMLVCATVGGMLAHAAANLAGSTLAELPARLAEQPGPYWRTALRHLLLLNHVFTFALPALLFAYWLHGTAWRRRLGLRDLGQASALWLGALLLLAAFPAVAWLNGLNQAIPLPAALRDMEQATDERISHLLVMASPWELLYSLLVIAVVPAFGEELLFRGLIQQRLCRYQAGPHVAVWATAFVFSAIHFQFEGFLPRLALGAVLGYLLLYTRSLWVPIFAHFVHNGLQVLAQYVLAQKGQTEALRQGEAVASAEWDTGLGTALALLSATLVWWLLGLLRQMSEKAA